MASMRLATAIRMGSLLIENPAPCDSRYCAVGMGLHANGTEPSGAEADYESLRQLYPWINNSIAKCPFGCCQCFGTSVVWKIFDHHVILGKNDPARRMTIEQLCDFIDSIDPTPRDSPEPESNSQEVTTEKVNP